MSEAFSPALSNVLWAVAPGHRPSGQECYPPQCKDQDIRVGTGESPSAWFKRVVDGPLEADLQACTIEPNLAIFLKFGWQNKRFRYINCQALALVDGTLADVYFEPDKVHPRYLRLDYDGDPLMLGELFSHPVIHIHGQPDEAPRFAIETSGDSNTALLDFFDFLYRNFCHKAWCKWANAVWKQRSPTPDTISHFESIRAYFTEPDTPGKRAKLEEMLGLCRKWIPAMKRAFRAAKRDMPLALELDPHDGDLFTYHHG